MGGASIPKTAPFAEEEIEILNRVVAAASPLQRAWLSGFLAGVDTGTETAIPTTRNPRPAEPLTVIYATESGNAERLAGDVAKAARKHGLKPTVMDIADFDVASLSGTQRLVLIASTWGEGEPPARAGRAFKLIMADSAPRLTGLAYGVLALGDRAYANFCAVGVALDERLAALGATRAIDRADCDLDFGADAATWIATAVAKLAPADEAKRGRVIEVDFGNKASSSLTPDVFEAQVVEHINLNSSRSEKRTIHLELAFDGRTPPYKPGDSLEVFVENDPAYIDELLGIVGLTGNASLRAALISSRDATTLSIKTLKGYVAATGDEKAKQLLQSGNARQWMVGRQLIDLVETFVPALSAEQLLAITRPLAPRAYSIASARRELGEEAHLLISAVRYESHGRLRKGVASGYLAERLRPGARLRVQLRPNRHFALPADDRDIIMIGPGSGVAPFRSFVQERRALAARGRNWLFFGDRHFTHDFLYQLEWQQALKEGTLTRLDLAFSRDTPRKIYVQHRLWEQRRTVLEWLDGGAYFYVCGDAKAMAKDVRLTLSQVFAEVKHLSAAAAEQALDALEQDGRYLQDVY